MYLDDEKSFFLHKIKIPHPYTLHTPGKRIGNSE